MKTELIAITHEGMVETSCGTLIEMKIVRTDWGHGSSYGHIVVTANYNDLKWLEFQEVDLRFRWCGVEQTFKGVGIMQVVADVGKHKNCGFSFCTREPLF